MHVILNEANTNLSANKIIYWIVKRGENQQVVSFGLVDIFFILFGSFYFFLILKQILQKSEPMMAKGDLNCIKSSTP